MASLAAAAGVCAHAQSLPFNFTVEGRLYDSTGGPLNTTTGFVMFELLSEQSSTCVLYREQFPAIDLSSSDPTAIGVFSLRLGSGTRNFPAAGVPLPTFFKAGAFSGDGNDDNVAGDCSTSITAADHTLVRIKFKTSGGGSWETLSPDTRISAVPTAMVADSANTLQGLSASAFLLTNVSTSLSQANLENVFSNTNYSTLTALLSGGYIASTPTSAVSFNAQRLTNVADPVAAQDVATKSYADSTMAGKSADTTGVGPGVGGGKVLVWDQALAKWVAQVPAAASLGIVSGTGLVGGTISSYGTLSVDVGTTGNKIVQLASGALPAVDGFLLTNIQFPVLSVAGRMGSVTLNWGDIGGLGTAAAKNYGVASGDLVELVAASKLPVLDASLLMNVNANSIQSRRVASVAPSVGQVLTWNGSQWGPESASVSAITALTGDITASGVGSVPATISANAVTSAKISNSGVSVNRILITDASTGANITYATCLQGEVMKYDVTTGWGCASDASSGGTLTAVVAGAGLLGGTISSFGTLSVDVGTTGNQIVQLAGGALPAVDGYLLTNIQFPVQSVAGQTGVVTLTVANIGGLGAAATKDYGIAAGNLVEVGAASTLPALDGSALTNVNALSIQSRRVASVAPTVGQVLTWNGSQWGPESVSVSAITALTGDVTASGVGSVPATISTGAVTSAKIAPGYAANRLLITDGSTGSTVTYAACAFGEVMKFTATGWGCASDANSGGTVTSITAGAGLLGGTVTTSGAFSVDIGTTAGKIVQLDGLGRLPGVDGSQLTNMPSPIGELTAGVGTVNVGVQDSGKIFKLTGLTNVNLPPAVGNTSVRYQFIRRGGGRVNIFPNGAETINGKIGKVLAADYSTISIVSDGTEWLITSALGAITNYSLTVQGILSLAFNGQGYLTHATLVPGATNFYISGATEDVSGRALVTGSADMGAPNNQDIFVARFNTDGSLDNTFGTAGIYVYPMLDYQQANAIKVDGSGNVVIGGSFQNPSDSDLMIMRLTSAGVLDPSFDSDGIRTISGSDLGYSNYYNNFGSIAIDGAGKIVVAASVNTGSDNDFATIRLNSDGSFDTGFNGTGYAFTDGIGNGGYDSVSSVAVDSSNNIYLCGTANGVSATGDLAVIKYTNAGALDLSFGTNGKFSHDGAGGASSYEGCTAIKIDSSSGKPIVLGSGYNASSNSDIIVWRLTTTGALDTTFALTGFHRFNGSSNDYDTPGAFTFDSSGNILVTGSTPIPGQMANMLVYRLTPAGVLDTDFNSVGYMTHNGAAGGNGTDVGRFIQVNGNGVTVLGTSYSGSTDFLTFWRLE